MPRSYLDAIYFLSRAVRHLENRQVGYREYPARKIIIDAQTECVKEFANA